MGLLTSTRRRRWRSENTEQPDPRERLGLKLTFLRLMVLFAFAVLTAQLVRMQLVHGDQYAERAALNQLRVEPVIPSRGLIYDRNGQLVVDNVPSFAAVPSSGRES